MRFFKEAVELKLSLIFVKLILEQWEEFEEQIL